MNLRLLKAKLILAGENNAVNAISQIIGKSRQTARNRLIGANDFTTSEISAISHKYNFTAEEIKEIFTDEEN